MHSFELGIVAKPIDKLIVVRLVWLVGLPFVLVFVLAFFVKLELGPMLELELVLVRLLGLVLGIELSLVLGLVLEHVFVAILVDNQFEKWHCIDWWYFYLMWEGFEVVLD
jgi:hypothetical protein